MPPDFTSATLGTNFREWLPLIGTAIGIPDVDKRIEKIKTQSPPKNTVPFLDALDEDTLAIVNHAARLRELLDLTRDFHKPKLSDSLLG